MVAPVITASAALARITADRSAPGPVSTAMTWSVVSCEVRGSRSSIMASTVGSRSIMPAIWRASTARSMKAASRSAGAGRAESRLSMILV
jgi:hypothetical protein